MNITNPESLEEALLPRDPDARARYLEQREYKLRVAAREAKAQAFAAAFARASPSALASCSSPKSAIPSGWLSFASWRAPSYSRGCAR